MYMSAIVLSSGGKDSILSLHLASESGINLTGIISVMPENVESMLYHSHNVQFVSQIADSLGIKWHIVHAPSSSEEEVLIDKLKTLKAKILVIGGITSNYQKKIFEKIARDSNMSIYSPLWGLSDEDVLSKITEIGLTTVIIAVAAYGLDKTWLGKQLTKSNIALLLKKSKICKFNATGEGGEYDTFVLDGPLFKKKLVIDKSTEHWFGDRGNLEINDVVSYNKERIL